MPFLSGALSVRRFMVMNDISASLPQTATLAMRRYTFRPIDDTRGEKESVGWVNPRNILAEQFTYDDVITQSYMLLGVRRDRKVFSPVLYRARRHRKFEEVKKERGLEKLSRQQRLALEEELTIEMLKETSPTSAFSELVWEMNSNIVLMGATSNALCDRIQELFEATFDMRLRPVFPALTGAEYISTNGLDDEYHMASAGTQKTVSAGQQADSESGSEEG